MLGLAPGALFNFLRLQRQERGANSKGGAYFVYQILARYRKLLLVKLETFSRRFLVNKVKHLCAHMDISIDEMRSKPVRL